MDANKRIAFNTSILYVKLIVSIIVGLYTSRLVLQALGASDFGLYSVVGGIVTLCTNRLTIDKLDDCEIWLKKLGNNNLQKGENLLRSAKRLLDETTGKILKVELYHKHDVYTLTRWACQEYNDLRMKDNMDLNNKRLRCGEIISSLVTTEFSFRLNRLMTFGKKADLNNYREVFSFPGDIIIQKMNSSGIIRYNDVINDMTFFSKTKYTKLLMVY